MPPLSDPVSKFGKLLRARATSRYVLGPEIASGGMASVHVGKLVGLSGFDRTVAIKRLHRHLVKEQRFVSMLVDEARLASRIRHPNVVPILDVVVHESEVLLVMDYVEGETLARLQQAKSGPIPLPIASAVAVGLLRGLHAAHEATSSDGNPLMIVHRDVSPQNVMVGVDGVPRLVDFGIAKAADRLESTREGVIKGKLAYMAPEQLRDGDITRRTDIYAVGVVLWEMLCGRRLFQAKTEAGVLERVLIGLVGPPSKYRPELPPALDELTLRALDQDPLKRFESAREMADALERLVAPALPSEVGHWVRETAQHELETRGEVLREAEGLSPDGATFFGTTTYERDAGERRKAPWVVGLLLALAALGGALAFVQLRASPPLLKRVLGELDPTSALAVSGPEPPAAQALPPASATPAPSTAPARAVRNTQPRRPPPARCNPPYTMDSNGRKTYKRECL